MSQIRATITIDPQGRASVSLPEGVRLDPGRYEAILSPAGGEGERPSLLDWLPEHDNAAFVASPERPYPTLSREELYGDDGR